MSSRYQSKYEQIQKAKKDHPEKALMKLCGDAGVSYQSYNTWVKKHYREEAAPSNKIRIQVMLSVEELAALISKEVREIPVPVTNLIRSLKPEELKALANALGMEQVNRFSSAEEGHIPQGYQTERGLGHA